MDPGSYARCGPSGLRCSIVLAKAALVRGPDGGVAASAAVAEAVGGLAEPATVVLLFASATHDPRPIVAAARAAAPPRARLIGCAASGVLADATLVEDGHAVAAMALCGVAA